MSNALLPVNEVFGPTIQGEGPQVGYPCMFLRLHHCPVHCPGCDTSYTWNGTEPGKKGTYDDISGTIDALLGEARRQNVGLVVSGGEPLLQHNSPVLERVVRQPWSWVGLETSGYVGSKGLTRIELSDFLEGFTSIALSPKITPCLHGRQSDEELGMMIPIFMNDTDANLHFKFVVKDDNDIDAILACDLRHEFLGAFPTYLMPYGNDRNDILLSIEKLVPIAAKYGFLITPRLQALLWGAERKK